MDAGPGTALGALGWFLGVWVVMMAAMMFPSLAPTAALYATMTRRHGSEPRAAVRRRLSPRLGRGRARRVRAVRAGQQPVRGRSGLAHRRALVRGRRSARGRGAYELTPLKDVCLAKCRSPLGFLLGSWRDGRSARADGLTARGVVLGLLLGADGRVVRTRGHESRVDGVVAALIALEKTLPWRRTATWGTAAILVVLAVAVVAVPALGPGAGGSGLARATSAMTR